MGATPNYTIDQKDIFKIELCHFACGLPLYKQRSESYLQEVMNENPHVILMQGVSPESYTLQGALRQAGFLSVGTYKKSVYESTDNDVVPSINMTWVAPNVQVLGTRNVPIEIIDKKTGMTKTIAPDCVITTVYHRGRTLDIYNVESVPGVFHSEARMLLASIVNKDAYILKTRNQDHYKALLIMGGNMHVDPEGQSIRYFEGRITRPGYAPSGWRDVWEELNPKAPLDRSATQRLEMDALYDNELVFPQFMQARRQSYFFVYNDVFGKIGTPVKITRNGMNSTDDGIPYSDSFGLEMELYMPTYNKFTTEDSFIQNNGDDDAV